MSLRFRVAARPRPVLTSPTRVGLTVVLVAVVPIIVYTEATLANNPTMGGFLLLDILTATWLLPTSLSSGVVLAALIAPWAALADGSVDAVTATFQFIALAVTGSLAEGVVREVSARDRDLTKSNERLRQFAADVAHEIRTPLTALRSHLDGSVRQRMTAAGMDHALRQALQNTDRVIAVSEALLVLARSDAGVLSTQDVDVDLADLVAEACDRWQSRADSLGVHLVEHVVTPGGVRGDPILIERLLDNLIDNSLRHTPRGGDITMELLEQGPDQLELSVTDTGTGIAPEFATALFERFHRSSGPAGHSQGAGLGLALCAAVARAHRGSIAVDPTVTGTRIVVRLPVIGS